MIQGSFNEKFKVLMTSLSKDKDSAETKTALSNVFLRNYSLGINRTIYSKAKNSNANISVSSGCCQTVAHFVHKPIIRFNLDSTQIANY